MTSISSPSETLRFVQHRKLKGAYLDVGSNTGLQVSYFLNECPSSLVIGIDGNQQKRDLLIKNIREANSQGKPAWFLPSFISTQKKVYFNPSTGKTGESSFLSEARIAETSELAQAVPLDDLAPSLPQIDFMAVHVENHEKEVLESARQMIARHRPELCVEVSGDNFPKLKAMLLGWGYIPLRHLSGSNWYFIPGGPLSLVLYSLIDKVPKGKWLLLNFWFFFWSPLRRFSRRTSSSVHSFQLPEGMVDCSGRSVELEK